MATPPLNYKHKRMHHVYAHLYLFKVVSEDLSYWATSLILKSQNKKNHAGIVPLDHDQFSLNSNGEGKPLKCFRRGGDHKGTAERADYRRDSRSDGTTEPHNSESRRICL